VQYGTLANREQGVATVGEQYSGLVRIEANMDENRKRVVYELLRTLVY